MTALNRDYNSLLATVKKVINDIQIGDNIIVRRNVLRREEMCLAKVIEIKKSTDPCDYMRKEPSSEAFIAAEETRSGNIFEF